MKANSIIRLGIAAAAALAIAGHAQAQTPGPQNGGAQPGSEHRGPPPEAIAACKSSALNQACSFTSPKGAESGACWQPDASHPLACRPNRNGAAMGGAVPAQGGANGEASQHHGPPPESLAACKNRKLNDACSFTSSRGAMSGSCFQPDASKPLACRPSAPR